MKPRAERHFGAEERQLMDAIYWAVWEAEEAASLRRPCICGGAHPPRSECWMRAWGYDLPPVEEERQ